MDASRLSTTHCRLSVAAYSIYSQLASISGDYFLHTQPKDASWSGDKWFILILLSHLRLGLSSNLFSLKVFWPKFSVLFIYSMSEKYSGYTTLFDFIVLIRYGKKYTLWISSLCTDLCPWYLLFLRYKHLLSTLFSKTMNLYSSVR
jgi:hypothetical protein